MRLSAAVVLLNVCLLVAVQGLHIPKLPSVPKLPDAPTIPSIPSKPGEPYDQPGRLPSPPTKQPDTPSCKGKKRMECEESDYYDETDEPDEPEKWDELDVDTNFREPGRGAMKRLDDARTNLPGPYNGPTLNSLNTRYAARQEVGKIPEDEFPYGLEQLTGKTYTESDWVKLEIRNSDEVIQRFQDREMAANPTPKRVEEISGMASRMKGDETMLVQHTSEDGKVLILDKFFNARYDLYRKYDTETDANFMMYQRAALDEDASIRFTDQVMLGWLQAIGTRDPKQVGLDKIVHGGIITDETNNVIEATLERFSKDFGPRDDGIVEFHNNQDLDEHEGFEALMGTVHGKRTAEMLTDYHHVVGDLTVEKISIALGGVERTHDMVISLRRLS